MNGVPGEIYNIGAGEEVNNLSIAKLILRHLKKDISNISFVKDRPGHDRRYAVDASKIKRELGWKPKHSFKTSFESTIDWYVENAAWVRRALACAGVANTHI